MKNILFNSMTNIDDDLLDMTAKKIKRAKPRKIALRVTGFAAAAAAAVFAVNLGVSFVNKNKIPVQSEVSLPLSAVSYEGSYNTYQGKTFYVNIYDLPFKYNRQDVIKIDEGMKSEDLEFESVMTYSDSEISYITGNNPWNDNLQQIEFFHLNRLPVFKIVESDYSAELDRINSLIDGTGITAKFSADDNAIIVKFPASLEQFPQNYNDDSKIYADEMKRIVEKYSDILGFTDFELDISGHWISHEDELLKCWHTKIYPYSENAYKALFDYNFNTVTFCGDTETSALSLKISNRLNSLECFNLNYPMIDSLMARESLLSGNYYTAVSEEYLKNGITEDRIAHTELVYRENTEGFIAPYYRFLVQLDDDQSLPEGLHNYGAFYYPATANNLIEEDNTSSTEQKAFYDDTFVGLALQGSGPRTTYNEVMDSLTSQSAKDRGTYIDSFYLVETVRALSTEEYDWDSNDSTIYEVKIIEDLISGEDINRTEKILISNGTPKWQYEYDPAYAPGERFTVALGKPKEGKDYIETPGSYMFKYDVPSDGSGYIYSRVSEMDKLNLPTSENIKEIVVTSTTQNPAGYTQKVTLDAVVEFLRSDWKARGVSSHFDGSAS